MASIAKRVFHNSPAGVYGFAVNTATQLLIVTILILAWGKTRYGEWLVLSSLPAYFTLIDVGFGQVASNKVAMLQAKGDGCRVQSVLHTMWLVQTVIGIVAFGGGAIAFLILPWASWLGLHGISPERTGWVLVGLLTYVLINMQTQPYSAIYRASGQMARFVVITNTSRIVELLVTLDLVLFGGAEREVVAGLIAVRLCNMAYCHWDVAGRLPGTSIGFRDASIAHIFDLIRQGVGHFGLGVA